MVPQTFFDSWYGPKSLPKSSSLANWQDSRGPPLGDREARLSEISEQKAGSEGCGLCVSMSRVSSSPHTSAELNSLASSERPQWAANGCVRSDSVLSVLSGSDDSMSSGVHDCLEGLDDTGALKCFTCQHG